MKVIQEQRRYMTTFELVSDPYNHWGQSPVSPNADDAKEPLPLWELLSTTAMIWPDTDPADPPGLMIVWTWGERVRLD